MLALQGAVAAHVRQLEACGAKGIPVRTGDQLETCDALVIPGGESTAISKLLDTALLRAPLEHAIATGLPVLGTCAGLILMARTVKDAARDGHPRSLGGLDIEVVRNAYGRQLQSCETEIPVGFDGPPFHGVFIRAPIVTWQGPEVEVIATYQEKIVGVRQGNLIGTSFHPELTPDISLHEWFLSL